MPTTPNMGLILPTPTVTPGPLYASENNNAFSAIDSHNHTSGLGVPIPSSALNINGDVSFQNNNLIVLKSSRYADQVSPLSGPSDLACVYSVAGDLYYNDGIGNQIQLTIGGALNATSIGGIGGDYSTSTASVFYTSLNNTFSFWQSSGVNATLDVGDIIVRSEVASAFGVHLTASASMSADYSLTLPIALPSVQSFMTLDASGNIAAPWTVDGVTIKIVGNQLVSGAVVEAQFNANGPYRTGTFVDGISAPFRSNSTIVAIWIYNLNPGASGTTEFDIKVGTSGGSFTSILSTTGKITSAAAANVWTDSGSVVGAQTGITKPVISSASVTAGQSLRFDILTTMVGASNCGVIIQYL